MRIGIELDIGVRKLEIDPEYGYGFRKFVEYALRLQAQREGRLSVTCIRVLDYFFYLPEKMLGIIKLHIFMIPNIFSGR